jgi:DNA-binding NarL/FixJ family response regulator
MRIAITSGDRLFLDSLVSLFSGSRFYVVAVSTDSRECVKIARQEQADILIFDLRGASSDDVQFLLGAQTFGDFRTVIIRDSEDQVPDGFEVAVARSDSAKILLERVTALGAEFVRPVTRGRGRPRMITNGLELSDREYRVACLIANGHTNQQIAQTMEIREQSVKNLVSTIIRKLRCENRVQVALRLSRMTQTD